MVSSVDGFIAKPDRSVSWLETTDRYDKGVDGEDAEAFMRTIGCFVMGSRTYEHAVELSREFGWAYGDVPTIVLTHRELPALKETVEFDSGDLTELVNERLKPKYDNIWVVGGAALVRDFIRAVLADEVRQTIAPILLGRGTPFFADVARELPLHLKDVTVYKNGMVELWYEIRKGEGAPP